MTIDIFEFFRDVNSWVRSVLFGEIVLDDTMYGYIRDDIWNDEIE
jgi:hypothetical protein